jgi:hypothetical protein
MTDANTYIRAITVLDRQTSTLVKAMPDRDQIRILLENYFIAPITDEHVTFIEGWYDGAARDFHAGDCEDGEHKYFDWYGWAWYEEVSINRPALVREKGIYFMDPVDHVLHMGHRLWRRFGSMPEGAPLLWPRPFCPPELVGSWQQVEPAHDEQPFWNLAAGAEFHSNSPDLPTGTRQWNVQRSLRGDLVLGLWENVWCERWGKAAAWLDVTATDLELVGVLQGSEKLKFRLRRADQPHASGRSIVSPSKV